jgi:hypothetical protein
MKLRSIYLALSLGLTVFSYAQTEEFPEKEFSLFAGPSYGNIKNSNIMNDEYADTRGSIGVNGGLNYCKFFSKNIGFNFGAEFSQFKNTTEYKGFYRSDQLVEDADGYLYYPVAEVDYKETRKVSCFDIPLALRLQHKMESAAFFLDLGAKVNLVLSSKFEQKGSSASKGLYPYSGTTSAYLLLENVAYLNYHTVKYNKDEDMLAQRINYSFMLGAGVKAKLGEKCFLLVNPYYMIGLNDIMAKNQKEYRNVFGEKKAAAKFILTQFALRVGLTFEI